MKVSHAGNQAQPAPRRSLLGSLWRVALLVGVLLVVGIAAVLILNPVGVQHFARDIEDRWGYEFRVADPTLTQMAIIATGSYLRSARDDVEPIPELAIDVPFEEMSKIYEKRDAAIERGLLIQGDDDFVKAEIRYGDRTIPVKMRLKGDWTDHLTGLKWSFRIHTRDGEELFGFRRFSIQNPATRGFQSELLFFDLLDMYGVMHPRYIFVDVTLNGESIGIMALEEFFSKELLEFNRRRESVIVRFDESRVWSAIDSIHGEEVGWGGAFDHYSNAPVDAFGSSRIAQSPFLSNQYRIAEGLLRGFVSGELEPSEVFDVEQMGAFLGISEFFGAWHPVAWHNMRFYLNPITLRLEPVVFDADLRERFYGIDSIINDEPMVAHILSDPAMWARYAEVLRELAAQYADGSLEARLRAVEEEPLRLLQTEFRLLNPFPLNDLQERLTSLLERAEEHEANDDKSARLYHYANKEVEQYPVLANFGLTGNGDQMLLQVETAIPKDVRVTEIDWVNADTNERLSAVADAEILPLDLPARGIWAAGQTFDVALQPLRSPGRWYLQATAGVSGRNWVKQFAVPRINLPLDSPPIPVSTLEEQLETHAFLKKTAADRLEIADGTWQVDESLLIPAGYTLYISAGATLQFGPDTLLISRSPLRVAGKAYAPVVFEPSGDGWPGMIVMEADGLSVVEHLVVRDTTSVALGGWSLTGGVNFYASDVELDSCEFRDSHGEDALNIIHSRFEMRNTVIDGTASDAFDGDFATGTVHGGEYRNVGRAGGGDAIDVSGSQVSVIGTVFNDVSDKAISVGERSNLTARDVQINNVGTGAAAKDGSQLVLSNATIVGASFAGLTAYIKKPEYGPAEIIATDVTISDAETPVLVQTGSRVQLDGEDQPTEDVDVDELYETVMRKGLVR